MSKKNRKGLRKNTRKPVNPPKPKRYFHEGLSPLQLLFKQRTGGPAAIQGFLYQVHYSCYRMLNTFSSDSTDLITLEGFEDLDVTPAIEKVCIQNIGEGRSEHVQVKYTSSPMDSNVFWKKEILQHFARVFVENTKSQFVLVTNHPLRKGNLQDLIQMAEGSREIEKGSYWAEKLDGFLNEQKKNNSDKWQSFDPASFVKSLRFEIQPDPKLLQEIQKSFVNGGITTGNEQLFYNSLSWNIFTWCKDRKEISAKDFLGSIEEVKRHIGKGIVNPALQNRWIEEVSFQKNQNEADDLSREAYFSGKAARPGHIVAGFPIDRDVWKKKVLSQLQTNHAVIIRASSGQGKSTLAWQTAWDRKLAGYSVLEMHWCKDEEKVGGIVELLESYVKAGDLPIVVVDGLNSQFGAWSEVVGRTSHLPVKYIITSREEDWHRYGVNIPQIKLAPVELQILEAEAKNIYNRLKKEGHIHSSVTSWQSCWERVRGRGLLLEYTYLLSYGTMIQERIEEQVKTLASDDDAKSKLEILRLVSLADLCNVKIEASDLLWFLEEKNIGFVGDRGKVLESLHKEYHVFIQEGHAIEGLHPVRSEHLSDALQTGVPLLDTATSLIQVIDPEYLTPAMLNSLDYIQSIKHRHKFIVRVADIVEKKPFADVNKIIDGLFAFDAREHHRENHEVYDELFLEQSLELSIFEAFPWSGITPLSSMINTMSEHLDNGAVELMKQTLSRIHPFVPEDSYTYVFLQERPPLNITGITLKKLEGLGTYVSWLSRFDIDTDGIFEINDSLLRQLISSLPVSDSSNIASTMARIDVERYRGVISGHEEELFSMLKGKTQTLDLYEKDGDLLIEYFVNESMSANEQGVTRVNAISSILPGYVHYETNGLRAPIPGLDAVLAQYDEAYKRMPAKNAENPFQQKINQTWLRHCLQPYEYMTEYDWQERIFYLRRSGLTLAKSMNQYVEHYLEGNPKIQRTSPRLIQQRKDFIALIKTKRYFSKRWRSRQESFKAEEVRKPIESWILNFQKVVQQYENLFSVDVDQEHLRRSTFSNINTLHTSLSGMQESFAAVEQFSGSYFDTVALKKDEKRTYHRLVHSCTYLYDHKGQMGSLRNARRTIATYLRTEERERISAIQEFLDYLKEEHGLLGYCPVETITEDNLRFAAFALEADDSDSQNMENFLATILAPMTCLRVLDIHFWHILFVTNKVIRNPAMVRVNQSFLEDLSEVINEGLDTPWSIPLPMPVDEAILRTLPDVKYIPKENPIVDQYAKILNELWHLSEAKARLDIGSIYETRYLDSIISSIKKEQQQIHESTPIYEEIANLFNDILSGLRFEVDYFQDLFLRVSQM